MYLNLIRKIAWSFHSTTNFDWEELFSEGCVAYCEALKSFKPGKCKEFTWINRCVTNHLKNFLRKERSINRIHYSPNKKDHSFISPLFLKTASTTYKTPEAPANYFFELYDSFTSDTKIIADMILNTPTDYAKLPGRLARGKVTKDLRAKGWTYPRIWKGVRNFKEELSEI